MPTELAQPSDESLIGALAAGDHDALAELYDRYGATAYRLAHRVLRDAALAEDAVHGTRATAGAARGRRGTGMNDTDPHEPSAGYAFHALDPEEARAFEAHLEGCARCRVDVASFRDVAVAIALTADAVEAPAGLRGRIAAAARESAEVVPLAPRRQRRRVAPALGAIAAVAACAAIGLGIWGASVSAELDDERHAAAQQAAILELLADGAVVPLIGAEGSLVVSPADRSAALLVSSLDEAPEGLTYQAWVIDEGAPVSAGTFAGGAPAAVALAGPVPEGAIVAVTIEQAGGAAAPTSDPIFSATAA